MDVTQKIEKSHYRATEQQIEQLAKDHNTMTTAGVRITGIYLRALIAASQAKLGPKGRGRAPGKDAQLHALAVANEKFYAAVLRGVTTPEIAAVEGLAPVERTRRALERNRRSNFARTAAGSLTRFAERGGDLRGLDLKTVTKRELDEALQPPGVALEPSTRYQGALLKAIERRARGDPEGARQVAESAIAALRHLLILIPSGQAAESVATTQSIQRTAVGRRLAKHDGAGAVGRRLARMHAGVSASA